MTKQEAFDKAYRGVIKQGEPAADDRGNCLFRIEGGSLKCNLGHLIPNRNYIPEMENLMPFGRPQSYLEKKEKEAQKLLNKLFTRLGFNRDSCFFFQKLQSAHDEASAISYSTYGTYITRNDRFLKEYKINMRKFAKRFRLSSAIVK